jgi:hypothetical protein
MQSAKFFGVAVGPRGGKLEYITPKSLWIVRALSKLRLSKSTLKMPKLPGMFPRQTEISFEEWNERRCGFDA